jgi:hypothetical protein
LNSRTFVRAACLATLIVGGSGSITFLAMAIMLDQGTALAVGLFLVPLMVAAIWMIAAVLGTALLLPKWLWDKRHHRETRARYRTAGGSGLWDGWLDGPSRA